VAVIGSKKSTDEKNTSSNENNSIKNYLCSRNFKNCVMPQLINYGSEMLRISPKGIEYSTSGGRSWNMRYSGSSCGTFMDLLPYGNELLAVTSKGIYYSTSQGRSWNMRYSGSSCGDFLSLADGGRELLANTSKGLYYSTSAGRSWNRRS
jgi:hypothetical protein